MPGILSDENIRIRENLRWAKPRIEQCDSLQEAFRLFHEIKERGIKDSIVGQLLLMRLFALGQETYTSGYADVEEYFGFKTVFDYMMEHIERTRSSDKNELRS